MSKKSIIVKSVSVMLVFALLLPMFLFSTNAMQEGGKKIYVYDHGNWIEDRLQADLNMLLVTPEFVAESVIITYGMEKMPSDEYLLNEVKRLIDEKQYGIFDGKEVGTVFFFANRVPSTGKLEVAVVPTMSQRSNYTQYQVDFIAQTLADSYAKNQDMKVFAYNMSTLLKIYLYPVINEMGSDKIDDELILELTREIDAWRKKYGQNIVFLLNHGFAEGLFDKYAEDYFISQGYGVGDEQSGTFLIYDDATGMFEIRLYGTADKGFSQESLNGLADKISKHLATLDLRSILYEIEKFLEPLENIPLLTGDNTGSEVEDHAVEEPILDGIPQERPLTGVVDPLNVLETEDFQNLVSASSIFNYTNQANLVSVIYDMDEMADEELGILVDELYQGWYGEEPGVVAFFDRTGNRIKYHVIGEYDSLYEDNQDAFENLISDLEEKVLVEEFSANSIVNHQLKMIDFLNTLKAKRDGNLSFIDETGIFASLEYDESRKALNKEDLLVTVFNKSDHKGYASLEEWLQDYQDTLSLSGLYNESIVMGVKFEDNKYAISYHGENAEIRDIVEKEILPQVEEAMQSYGALFAINKFYELSAKKLTDYSGTTDTSGDLDSIKVDDLFPSEAKKSLSGAIRTVIIVAAVFLLLFVGVIIIVIIMVKKKAKKKAQTPMNPQNPMNSANQPFGYNQGYQGQAPQSFDNSQSYQGHQGQAPQSFDNSQSYQGYQGQAPQSFDNSQSYQGYQGQAPQSFDNSQSYQGYQGQASQTFDYNQPSSSWTTQTEQAPSWTSQNSEPSAWTTDNSDPIRNNSFQQEVTQDSTDETRWE